MAIRAQAVGSVSKLKQMLAKGGGNSDTVRIGDGQELHVRFMEEPNEWIQYTEHFDKTHGYFPCEDGGTCIGCADDLRASKRYLTNVVDLDERKVIALVMPYTLADDLVKRYDRFNTLLDRQYDLGRTGKGIKDTSYTVDYGEAKRFDLSRFDPLDLMAILEKMSPSANENYVDDDEDEQPVRSNRPAPRQRDEDPADDDDFAPPARPAKKVAPPAARPAPAKKLIRRNAG